MAVNCKPKYSQNH